jgi:hypothetical protein
MNDIGFLNSSIEKYLNLDEARIQSIEFANYFTSMSIVFDIGWERVDKFDVKYPGKLIRIEFAGLELFEFTGDLSLATLKFPADAGAGWAEISSAKFTEAKIRDMAAVMFVARWETERSLTLKAFSVVVSVAE